MPLGKSHSVRNSDKKQLHYIITGEQLADVRTEALVPKKFAEIMVNIVANSVADQESQAGVIIK